MTKAINVARARGGALRQAAMVTRAATLRLSKTEQDGNDSAPDAFAAIRGEGVR